MATGSALVGLHEPSPRVRVAIVSYLACLLVLVSLLTSVQASASGGGDGCNPNGAQTYLNYYFDGWTQPGNGYVMYGAKADIWNYSPYVSGVNGRTDASVVTAWSMLTESTFSYWEQIGWFEYPFGTRHTVEQGYGPGYSSAVTNFDPAQTINTYTTYSVTAAQSRIGFIFSFQYGSNTSWFTDAPHFVPTAAEQYGETHSLADQMPGDHRSYYYYETFQNAKYQDNNHNWQSFDGSYSNGTYFDGYKASSTEIDIYDRRGSCP